MTKDIFSNLILPSDDEIKRETQYKKIGLATATRKVNSKTRQKMSDSHKQNWTNPIKHKERCKINKKSRTDEVRKKISDGLKGIVRGTPNTIHKEKLSKALKGLPKIKVICPHCKKEGGEGIMYRWHFDNCKHK